MYFEFSQNVNIFKNNPMFDVAVEILKISPMFGSIGEYFENYPMFDVVVEIFLKLPFGSAGEYFENYFYVWSRWRKFWNLPLCLAPQENILKITHMFSTEWEYFENYHYV